jgi:hypothetical protein
MTRSLMGRLGRRGVRFIDTILIRRHGLEVLAEDTESMLRSSFRRLENPLSLADGTLLESGDQLLEIHFWNERLPRIRKGGADLLWGRQFASSLARSLELLAIRATTDPRYGHFAAVHGQVGFIPRPEIDRMKRLTSRLGFFLELREAPGMHIWTVSFWACLYSWWLMWTFNPDTLRGKRFHEMAISDVWMTRETFLSRYGERSRSDAASSPR